MKAKVSSAKKKRQEPERNGPEWQRLYEELRKERNRLRKELAAVKKERDDYRKAVGALMAQLDPIDDMDLDLETLRARAVGQPSLEELIAELESEGAGRGKKAARLPR